MVVFVRLCTVRLTHITTLHSSLTRYGRMSASVVSKAGGVSSTQSKSYNTWQCRFNAKHHLIAVHSRMSPSLTAPHLKQVSDNSRRSSIRIVHDLAPSWWPCCPIYLFPQLAFSPPSPALYPEGFVQNTIIFSFLGHSSHYHEVLSPLFFTHLILSSLITVIPSIFHEQRNWTTFFSLSSYFLNSTTSALLNTLIQTNGLADLETLFLNLKC